MTQASGELGDLSVTLCVTGKRIFSSSSCAKIIGMQTDMADMQTNPTVCCIHCRQVTPVTSMEMMM